MRAPHPGLTRLRYAIGCHLGPGRFSALMNTLAKLAWSLEHGQHAVEIPEDVRVRAHSALQRMLEMSGGWGEPSPEEMRLEEDSMGAGPGCGCA